MQRLTLTLPILLIGIEAATSFSVKNAGPSAEGRREWPAPTPLTSVVMQELIPLAKV